MTRLYMIDIDPRTLPTAQQKGERIIQGKNGTSFIHHYEKSRVANGRKALESAIMDVYNKSGGVRFDKREPVLLEVEFVYPIGSLPKKYYGTYKVTRPDGDNLLKGLQDACTNVGIWHDDSQVQIRGVWRRYVFEDEDPHIALTIETI